MPGFQFYFELIGAVAFAISGAALAVKKHMDLFGVAMMGMTTAVGGGILRDLLLGITPPAALRDPLQALVAIATSLLVFLVWKRFHPEGDHRNWEALLLVADSIGLGIFSVHGAAVAVRAGLGGNVFLTLLVGMLTGVGGGVLRDLCCMERPYIFTKHIYACASLAGAAACMLLWSAGENLALLVGMLTGVGGGVLRDLCCMERPYIFTKHIYACASLAGAAACMLLWSAGENLALLTGCALTVVLRLCAAVFRWSLPKA